jgi:hypothetical protein
VRSPLWVPSFLLVGVLGSLASMVGRAVQGPPETLPSMLYPWSEPVLDWNWWEHASWMAGVGGFALSALALAVGFGAWLTSVRQLSAGAG